MGNVRRVVTSLAPPLVFAVGFPVAAILLGDANCIPWLQQGPQKAIATIVGLLLVAGGLALAVKTIPMFLRLSQGTIMPWDPANELIVEGVYRHVRNPMHTGVFAVVLGEGLILRSPFVLGFAAFAILSHLFYIPYSEERGLERRFGEQYLTYKANVPRWIPRLTPWHPGDPQGEQTPSPTGGSGPG
jgi:protein-S-isoprenylcysteine O-methyltransferase Ste14